MCNLYNITTNQESIRAITSAMTDNLGKLKPSMVSYSEAPK